MKKKRKRIKWVSKERGLRLYSRGRDVYGETFRVQDGSWACFRGVRIYGHDCDNEKSNICLSLKLGGAKTLIKGLQQFIKDVKP